MHLEKRKPTHSYGLGLWLGLKLLKGENLRISNPTFGNINSLYLGLKKLGFILTVDTR